MTRVSRNGSQRAAAEVLDETVRQIESTLQLDDDTAATNAATTGSGNKQQLSDHTTLITPSHMYSELSDIFPDPSIANGNANNSYGTVDRRSLKLVAKFLTANTLGNNDQRSHLENHLRKGLPVTAPPQVTMGLGIGQSSASLTSPASRLPMSGAASMNPIQSMRLGLGLIVPVCDLKEQVQYSSAEAIARCKLASLYRLVDLHGWSQSIYNHITLKLDEDESKFLINPFGLLYHEISASKLLVLDSLTEKIIDPGTSGFGFNRAGWTIHGAVHQARPDAKCIIHIHTPEIVACSINPNMLTLPLCQEACILGPIGVHKYTGIVIDKDEMKEIQKDMGKTAKILLLENHGALVVGSSVEEAWHYLYHLMIAAKTQVMIHSTNLKGSWLEQKAARVAKLSKKTHDVVVNGDTSSEGPMPVGQLNFEAQMRSMDDLGYRTGYPYHNQALRPTTFQQRLALEAQLAQAMAEQKYTNDIVHTTNRTKSSQNSTSTPQMWACSPNRYEKRGMQPTQMAVSSTDCGTNNNNNSNTTAHHNGTKSSISLHSNNSSKGNNNNNTTQHIDNVSICSEEKQPTVWELTNNPDTNRAVQTSQGPIKLPANSLVPTNTDRHDAAKAFQVVKSIEEQMKRQNYVVEKTDHFAPKASIPDRDNPFVSKPI